MSIKIAICDDDIIFLKHLKHIIENYYLEQDLLVEVNKFISGESFLNACEKIKFSLVFLDIEMPVISGIEVVKTLYSSNQDMEIIFITGFDDYVFQTIKYKPLRFIRKSYIDNELPEALEVNWYYDFVKYTIIIKIQGG